jgi:hypothetical protein
MFHSVIAASTQAFAVMIEYPAVYLFCWILLESHSSTLVAVVPSRWNGSALVHKKQQLGSFLARLKVNNPDCLGWAYPSRKFPLGQGGKLFH